MKRSISGGLIVVAVAAFLYIPYMGSYGLWDPWEGHYAEVSRQMLERDDWINLHWHNGEGPDGRKENVFWSKPVLSFWLMAIGLRAGGMNDHANPGEMAQSGATEWLIRWPFALLGIFGAWSVWFAVSRLASRRAGLFAGLVLATSPQYFFVARQAMTDMPFVAPMTAALCFFLVAMFDPDSEREARRARAAFWAALAVCVVPQLLLLAFGLRRSIAVGGAHYQFFGTLDVAPYLCAAGALVFFARGCRTARQFHLFTFYLLCGVAMLAKGLPGPALPGLVILVYLLLTGEWAMLARAEIPRGVLVTCLVALPWYHGMLVKAGRGFWNEFFGHHHFKRLTAGVHGDKGTFEYFLHQLGFALFPWSGVVPAALVNVIGLRRPETPAERLRLFAALWFIVNFTIFSLGVTKFHHYILPALPPLAILVGIWLDDLVEGRARAPEAALLASLALFAFIARDLVQNPQRLIWLFVYNYGRAWPAGYDYQPWLLGFALAAGVLFAALLAKRLRRAAAWGSIAVAVAFTWFALNKFIVEIGPHWTQKDVLATYYRLRRGPEEELVAWQMNWRGETFYTKAQVVVALSLENAKFLEYLRAREGKRVFMLCERGRYASLGKILPTERAKKSLRIVDDRSNKFYLVVTDI
ncbi:MAG: glycosyltransferase family 39 protein [Myxococcota bacterium]